MSDLYILIAYILIVLFIVGGAVYLTYRLRSRSSSSGASAGGGIGTARRLYFYIVSFIALMMSVIGVATIAESALDLDWSPDSIASGLALIAVGMPLWWLHWRFVRRSVADSPIEARATLRKLYLYAVLAISLAVVGYNAFVLIEWLLGVGGDFVGVAYIAIWGFVWGAHWRIESAEREATATPTTRGIRRFYLYAASIAGGSTLVLGGAQLVQAALQEILIDAIGIDRQTLLGADIWHRSMRSALAYLLVGGGVWGAHFIGFARGDRRSILRWAYLFAAAVVGGATAALAGLGAAFGMFARWALGVEPSASTHFDSLDGALASAMAGAIIWAIFRNRMRAEAADDERDTVERIYNHILAAMGLVALVGATFLTLTLAMSVAIGDPDSIELVGESWRVSTANVIATLLIGAPVWGIYWRRILLSAAADETAERTSLPHRSYILAALGVAVVSLLASVSALAYMLFRALLELHFDADTMQEMIVPLAAALTVGLFAPYHWIAYRRYRALEPEPEEEPPAIRKRVSLLVPDDGGELARAVEGALGGAVNVIRWADADAYTPTPDAEQLARIAREVAESAGENALLMPQGDSLRVISHD